MMMFFIISLIIALFMFILAHITMTGHNMSISDSDKSDSNRSYYEDDNSLSILSY